MTDVRTSISAIGEKALIRDFIKPLFSVADDPGGVGDDCAMIPVGDQLVLMSTDRVPADLTAFRLGILDHERLGDYLVHLNLSDIAACGGQPVGFLLNLGLPETMSIDDLKALCQGVFRQATRWDCPVLGGDITSAAELSVSATAVGLVARDAVLTRRGACPGDSIFLSRPPGLTPAAFEYYLGARRATLRYSEINQLKAQFTSMTPMIRLGRALSTYGACTSCMDNTDGIGQSLTELADASGVAFHIVRSAIVIPDLLARIASNAGKDPWALVFNGGADFSLIGTLRGEWTANRAREAFGDAVQIVGSVTTGSSVWLDEGGVTTPLVFQGWNYFLKSKP